MEKRTVYALLAKPVHRYEFILGKYLGLLSTLLVNLVIMTAGLILTLMYHGGTGFSGYIRLLPAVYLIFLSLALTTALAPVDGRCIAIVGVGQRTVTSLECVGEEFVYAVSGDGDGTVPARSATLPGAPCYFFRGELSELPRSPTVARSLLDLIRKWTTAALRRSSALYHQPPVSVSDA